MVCRPPGHARYIDEILQKEGGSLKFRSRLCVYDSEVILNSLICLI